MKKSQNGFGTIEIVIVFIFIGLIAATGWYIYTKSARNHQSHPATTKIASQDSTVSSRYVKDPGTPKSWALDQENKTVISPEEKTPKSNLVTIDFPLCSKGYDSFGFGSGSTNFYFEGVENDKCHFYMGTEIENPNWDGYLNLECRVPTDYTKTFAVENGGAHLKFTREYCS